MITVPLGFQAPDADFSGRKILIVDDFQGMRSIFRDILRSCGADGKKIAMAANGIEAINFLSSEHFDVVLCDFDLGPGKNGQQVLEEAKFRALVGPACAWIMITAEKTSDAVTGAAEYQPDAYLLKPITESTLRLRLAKIWAKKEAFAEIDSAMKRHDYPKAIALCDKRLAFDKANAAELLRTKCDLLVLSGDMVHAKQFLEAVLSGRELPWAKVALAKVLLKSNDFNAARVLLEETMRDSPSFLDAYDVAAKTLLAVGDVEGAGRALERATKLSPNSVLRQKNLGEISLRMGQLENAERAFRKSVNLGENSVLKTSEAYLGLAKTCSAKANPDEALKVLVQLGKHFTDPSTRLKTLVVEGDVHFQNGNADKAKQIAVELAHSLGQEGGGRLDSAGVLEAARLLMQTGEKGRATELLQGEVRNNPENAALLGSIKEIFNRAEMSEEGAALIESSRREAMEMMNSGVLLARSGKYIEAIAELRHAKKIMPSNVRVLFNLAYVIIAFFQKSSPSYELANEARASLLAANALAPGDARFANLMALLNGFSSPV